MPRKTDNFLKFVLIVTLVSVWLLIPPAAFGQEGESAQHGVIEFGVRGLWGDVYGRPDIPFALPLKTSKFNEYRDINNGFFVRRADVRLQNLFGTKNYLNAQTQSSLLNDQSYLVTVGILGKYRLQFRFEETPHTFSNTAQTLFQETSPGVFTIPADIRTALVANPKSAPTFLANMPVFDLSLRRQAATIGGIINPTRDWTIGLQFFREKEKGYRPIGTYSPGYELPEPINYRTTRFQASAAYDKERWGLEFGFQGSIFENKVDTLVWDTAFSKAGKGRIDLYPDNTARNLNFAGAFDLSKSTRVMVSIVPGWMEQNDAFIPFTINPVANAPTELPAPSLNGSKQTLAMNYTLVNHAVKNVEFTARYRSYDYNNNTPTLLFPSYVLLDGSVSSLLPGASKRMPRANPAYAFNRMNAEFAAVWEFVPKNSLKIGYEFERYDRQHRDVRTSDENTFLTSLDLNPNKLTLIRLSYRHSDRNPSPYVENVENYPLGLEVRQQLPLFRRFDEAARARHRADALLQFSPLDTLSFSATYGTTQDKFGETPYGLLRDISFYYTADADYMLRPEVSLFAEYAREKYRTRQRSRMWCTEGAGLCSGMNNSPNNDWEAANRNRVDTYAAGTDVSLDKKKVVFTGFYSISASYGSMASWALGNSALPGFLLNAELPDCRFGGCTPQNFPDTKNRIHEVVASLKFSLPRGLSPRLEYRYERYDRVDWQTQRMRPYMFGVDADSITQLFLGADAPSYRAHVFAATLEYTF